MAVERKPTGRVALLENLAPEAWIEINQSDAEALKIRTGDVVRVLSPRERSNGSWPG